MSNSSQTASSLVAPASAIAMPRQLSLALERANLVDGNEALASFGRWWLDASTMLFGFSSVAAAYLGVETIAICSGESAFPHVMADDVAGLLSGLSLLRRCAAPLDITFRVLKSDEGIRWYRMVSSPAGGEAAPGLHAGVLLDVTALRQAAMREQFIFQSSQYLIGCQTPDEAIHAIIKLVCENLGWDWGAYWSASEDEQEGSLRCSQFWHRPDRGLSAFRVESLATPIAPGAGLIGRIWSTGQADWVEDIAGDRNFLRRRGARECGLHAGYCFPVTYSTEDGRVHRPGVVEFFSRLPRQRDAQLPMLSAAVGALIAQSVRQFRQKAHITRLEQKDTLTGVSSQRHFHALLDRACGEARRAGQRFALIHADLVRLRHINQAFGHEAGSAVLRQYSQRLLAVLPEGYTLARVLGGEFVMLSPPDPDNLSGVIEAIEEATSAPFRAEGYEIAASANLGIAWFPDAGSTGPDLLHQAARAGRGKALGAASLARQLTMEAELRHALARGEFFLEYQPVFDQFGERMIAIESLIRWRRQDGQIVRPDEFMPVAERSSLIREIGRWVATRACRDLGFLHSAGLRHLHVNVNMAASEFLDPDLPGDLVTIAESCGISADKVCLELTEGTAMTEPEVVIPLLKRLRQIGFRLSIDDFGMGYSSLSRLQQLPITSIKIDRSFVTGLPGSRRDGALVRTILDLGRHMNVKVIAEGVENEAQMLFLRQFGCQYMQGYLLGRPQSLADILRLHQEG